MKRILILFTVILMSGCKEAPKTINPETDSASAAMAKEERIYPKNMSSVFETHGGSANWQAKNTLSFTMPKATGNETHTVDLSSRKETITTPDFSMGYDGKDFWLVDEKEAYEGDPIFYHNLMFYFYAMPFVLSDDGINYGETKDLEFEGKSYPGIRISYDDGVGVSSKDEYFIHYDSETHQMAWLGYTVTYRSGEKSDNVRWIRYNDWQELDGLILPKSMTWYKVEKGKIVEPASTRVFEEVTLSNTPESMDFYAMPENGKVVTKQ